MNPKTESGSGHLKKSRPSSRCRRNGGHPVNLQTRSVTLPAGGCLVRLRRLEQKRPRRHRAVATRAGGSTALRVGVAFLSGSLHFATSCRPSPPLHFAVLATARRPLPPSPLLSSLSSCLLMPDAAADPSTPLRSFLAPLRCRAGWFAAAWLWRVAPLVRLRRFVLKGCHTHASALSGFLGGWRRFGSSIRDRRSRQEASRRRRIGGSFGLRAWHHAAGCSAPSSLHSAPPRTLAPLGPSASCHASGLRKSSAPRPAAPASFLSPCLRPPIRGEVFGNALRERLPCRRSVLARAAASGRSWRQALSSSLPALPRSCLACAAWSFLRERLTPRPPAAGGDYRFGLRQNKLGQLVGRGR